jgi:hypothetical protein
MTQSTQQPKNKQLEQFSDLELAQALMERLSIAEKDWHKLKSDRKARAAEQIAAALVYLLKNQKEEVSQRLEQATGWLNRSLFAPPCPTHGNKENKD